MDAILSVPDKFNPRVFRVLAEKARVKADAATDIDLQQSYLELAEDYDALAKTLERIQRKTDVLHSK